MFASSLLLIITFQNIVSETIRPQKKKTVNIVPEKMYPGRRHTTNSGAGNFSAYTHSGYMKGEANEYVINGDHKLSQLIWEIESLCLAGGGIEWTHGSSLSFTADLWLKTFDGDALMDDYDWLIEDYDWTHWSHHENTTVTKANIFDIYMTYTPLRFRNSRYKLNTLAGYRRTNFEWEARGGSYIYSDVFFRDTEGTFPDNELGITYEQIFNTPYVGLEAILPFGRFLFETKITGSIAVFGKAIDHHHLRDLVTTANFYWGNMILTEVSAGINFPGGSSLKGSFSWNRYGGLRGDSKYNQSGSITVYENLEAADFESIGISVYSYHPF
jgi:plasminogen activator